MAQGDYKRSESEYLMAIAVEAKAAYYANLGVLYHRLVNLARIKPVVKLYTENYCKKESNYAVVICKARSVWIRNFFLDLDLNADKEFKLA